MRAWTVSEGGTALDAAAAIHSDMARGFIRAEIYNLDDVVAQGSFEKLRGTDKMKLCGKEHQISGGDLVIIRFKV
ncbi:MAG: hypothetical protein A3I72_09775 [Candidatus Tectomicrobia bacterium RIFCSPLOWO2_02_FULL_70_19]|nr:MAG: hypothetical protein A3I72_09775 [Candidatus Tectomicrobia bacterium RIFCSPLOWO2_02_FULL_70_19]